MPTYDLHCSNCDSYVFDHVCRISDKDSVPCACGKLMETAILSAPVTIGATFSKPLDFEKQLGRTFETNAEFRQYMREHPEAEVVSKSDAWYTSMRDRLRNRMDVTSRKKGYRDYDHEQSTLKAKKS